MGGPGSGRKPSGRKNYTKSSRVNQVAKKSQPEIYHTRQLWVMNSNKAPLTLKGRYGKFRK